MAPGCAQLLDLIGISTQLAVFVTCAGVLLRKKLSEDTGRTWLDFSLDASKQLVGVIWAYLVGLLLGLLPGAPQGAGCDGYWATVVVHATLGVYFQYLLLNLASFLLEDLTDNEGDFRSGEYRHKTGLFVPERYIKQLLVWLTCIAGAKILLLPLMMLFLRADVMAVAGALITVLSWSPVLQLVVVTVITPCGMHGLQVWLTDSFLQKGGLPLLAPHDECGAGHLGAPLLDEEARPSHHQAAAGVPRPQIQAPPEVGPLYVAVDVADMPPLPPPPFAPEGEKQADPFAPDALAALQAQAADLQTLIQARDGELATVRDGLARVHEVERRLSGEIMSLGGTIPEGITQGSAASSNYPVGATLEILDALIMRTGEDFTSQEIQELLKGQLCVVLMHGTGPTGRRIQVKARGQDFVELEGWISCLNNYGGSLVRLADNEANKGSLCQPDSRIPLPRQDQAGKGSSVHTLSNHTASTKEKKDLAAKLRHLAIATLDRVKAAIKKTGISDRSQWSTSPKRTGHPWDPPRRR